MQMRIQSSKFLFELKLGEFVLNSDDKICLSLMLWKLTKCIHGKDRKVRSVKLSTHHGIMETPLWLFRACFTPIMNEIAYFLLFSHVFKLNLNPTFWIRLERDIFIHFKPMPVDYFWILIFWFFFIIRYTKLTSKRVLSNFLVF